MLLLLFVSVNLGAALNGKANFPVHIPPRTLVINEASQAGCLTDAVDMATLEIQAMVCSARNLGELEELRRVYINYCIYECHFLSAWCSYSNLLHQVRLCDLNLNFHPQLR